MITKQRARAPYIRALLHRATPAVVGCLLLVGCGQPDQGTINPQATPDTTATAMAKIADAGRNTRVPDSESLTAIALKNADLQSEQNLLATSAALPPAPPDRPLPIYPVQPTETIRVGIADSLRCVSDGFYEFGDGIFGVANCWAIISNGIWMRVDAGGVGNPGDPTSFRGAVAIYTNTLDFEHSFRSPTYYAPNDAGIVEIVQVNGNRLLLQAENGTQFVFNLDTRAWEDPATLPTATSPTSTP